MGSQRIRHDSARAFSVTEWDEGSPAGCAQISGVGGDADEVLVPPHSLGEAGWVTETTHLSVSHHCSGMESSAQIFRTGHELSEMMKGTEVMEAQALPLSFLPGAKAQSLNTMPRFRDRQPGTPWPSRGSVLGWETKISRVLGHG